MRKVRITIGPVELFARLLDTPAGRAVGAAMPFASQASIVDSTVQFATPAGIPVEDAAGCGRKPGELVLSRECGLAGIDFAKLPFHRRPRRPAERRDNVWARALGDIAALRHVIDGDTVIVEGVE